MHQPLYELLVKEKASEVQARIARTRLVREALSRAAARDGAGRSRRHGGVGRVWLLVIVAAGLGVVGAIAWVGGGGALGIAGGAVALVGVAAWRFGADSRDGRDWGRCCGGRAGFLQGKGA